MEALFALHCLFCPRFSTPTSTFLSNSNLRSKSQNMTEHCNGSILQNIWRRNEWRLCLLSTASLPQIFKANDNILHPISDLQNRTWQLSTWEIFDWISGYMKGRLICYPMHYLFVLDSNGQRLSSKILFEFAKTELDNALQRKYWKQLTQMTGEKIRISTLGGKFFFPTSFNTKLWASSQISKPLPNFPLICKKNVLLFGVPKY